MSLKPQINLQQLPQHIAVIMDGNGRWAEQKGEIRLFGHQNGVKAVRETVEACAELGVQYLTLYAFSTENWHRPKEEVQGLMSLLVETIGGELPTLQKNKIRLQAIGDLQQLPLSAQQRLQEAIDETAHNERMTLILALSYSARWELCQAMQQIGQAIAQGHLQAHAITEEIIQQYLCTKAYPDPELLIRTSGEKRISNFLLWQIAYAELYFTETFWPDFRKEDLYQAIINYQQRERRFGMTSQQIHEAQQDS